MKWTLCILGLLILCSFQKKPKKDRIVEARIFSSGDVWASLAWSRPCDGYEEPHGYGYRRFVIKDTLFLNNVVAKWMNESKPSNVHFKSFDVSLKMFAHYESGKIDTLCLSFCDYFFLNGSLIKFNGDGGYFLHLVDSVGFALEKERKLRTGQ